MATKRVGKPGKKVRDLPAKELSANTTQRIKGGTSGRSCSLFPRERSRQNEEVSGVSARSIPSRSCVGARSSAVCPSLVYPKDLTL